MRSSASRDARSIQQQGHHMSPVPSMMSAVLLTGHGGLEKLQYRADVPVPKPGADEVLIQVSAAGLTTPISIPGWGGIQNRSARPPMRVESKVSRRSQTRM